VYDNSHGKAYFLMDITLQVIGRRNAHILEAVADDVFDDAIDPDRLARYVEEANHFLVVALDEGLVVGQVRGIIHHHPDASPELYIDNAGVAPEFQRQGIGKKLMAEMITLAKAHGCEDIWLGTEADNEAAKALYLSLGFDMTDMVMFDGEI